MKKISLNVEQLRVDTFHVAAERSGTEGTVHGHGDAELFVTNAASGCNTCAGTCVTLVCFC